LVDQKTKHSSSFKTEFGRKIYLLLEGLLLLRQWRRQYLHTSGGLLLLRAFNEALLAKQGWRLLINPQSLVARILKAKYYPNKDFLKEKLLDY
jgi:hypothetical protein